MTGARVVVIDPDELDRRIEAAVGRALANRAAVPPAECDWIGADEVARMLGCARSYVRKVRGLPVHRVGRKRRYRRAEVAEFIASGAARELASVGRNSNT